MVRQGRSVKGKEGRPTQSHSKTKTEIEERVNEGRRVGTSFLLMKGAIGGEGGWADTRERRGGGVLRHPGMDSASCAIVLAATADGNLLLPFLVIKVRCH